MRAGETAMYGMRYEFARRGIHFTVVSGDMIDATNVLTRLHGPALAPRRSAPLPSTDEFAAAIAGAANSQYHPGIVCVGGSEYLRTA